MISKTFDITPDFTVLIDSDNWVLILPGDSPVEGWASNSEVLQSISEKVDPEIIESANNISLALQEIASQASNIC